MNGDFGLNLFTKMINDSKNTTSHDLFASELN
jgi:hypothetical protein